MEILDEFERSNPTNSGQNGLLINNATYPYLRMAATWGKILAIIGFVLTGFGALIGLVIMANIWDLAETDIMPVGVIWALPVFYYVILGFYIVPLLYLNRFATHLKLALQAESQQEIDRSFKNLGKLFKFLGILTIVIIGLYFLLYAGVIAFAVSNASILD